MTKRLVSVWYGIAQVCHPATAFMSARKHLTIHDKKAFVSMAWHYAGRARSTQQENIVNGVCSYRHPGDSKAVVVDASVRCEHYLYETCS
jgi:hypothetical protein